jgi:hypothetical protein
MAPRNRLTGGPPVVSGVVASALVGLKDRVLAGAGRAVAVSGWRWTGKSGLVGALEADLRGAGAAAICVRGRAGSSLVAALAGRAVEAAARAGAPEDAMWAWLSAVGRGEGESIRVFREATLLCAQLKGGVVVIVDDAHFAEDLAWKAIASIVGRDGHGGAVGLVAVGLPGFEMAVERAGISYQSEWLPVTRGGGWGVVLDMQRQWSAEVHGLPDAIASRLAEEACFGALVWACSPGELRYLSAIAAVGEGVMGEAQSGVVAQRAGSTTSSGVAGRMREQLVRRGLVASRRYGWVELAVPGLRDYLVRWVMRAEPARAQASARPGPARAADEDEE